MLTTRHVTWALVVILLAGFALLVRDLDGPGLWVDEGWSMVAASRPNLNSVTAMIREDVHPPLHTLLLSGWQRAVGLSVFAARYNTVLITLLACAMLYRAGRALFGIEVGVLAVGLFLLNNQVIVLGQEVRQYALAQMLAALSLWTYWRFWRRPAMWHGALFVLAGAVSMWTLYWNGFVLLGTAIHALLTSRRRRLMLLVVAHVAIGVTFVPWLPVLFTQITRGIPGGLGHALPNSSEGLGIVLFQLVGRPELFWVLLAAAGAIFAGHGRRPTTAHLLPATVIIAGVSLTVLINTTYSVMTYRAMSVFIPALVLLVAAAVAAFRNPERRVMLVIVLGLALLPGVGPQLRLPWEQVATFITQHSAAGDRVLIATCFDTFALTYYLEQTPGVVTPVPAEVEACIRQRDNIDTYVHTEIAGTNGLWVIDYASSLDLWPVITGAGFVPTGQFVWDTPFAPVVGYRYDRPPANEALTVFGDALALEVARVTHHEDGTSITLLWTALDESPVEYTVSAFLLDANGMLVAQHDSYPLYGTLPTTGWQAGGLYYDAHFLPLAQPEDFRVGVKVYTFADTDFQQVEIIPPTPCADDACTFILLDDGA